MIDHATDHGVSRTGTASASPIIVSGLTNGTAYSCTVTAVNAVGSSPPSGLSVATRTAPPTTGTASVLCALSYSAMNTSVKVNALSSYNWTCNKTQRLLTGTGIPDHAVVGGNFATPVSRQNITATFSLTPTLTGTVTAAMVVGYALNSVKLDPGTAGTCASTATSTQPGNGGCALAAGQDPWRIEAFGGASRTASTTTTSRNRTRTSSAA